MLANVADEDDDEFITPRERFDSFGKNTAGQPGRKSGCSVLSPISRVRTGSSAKHVRIEARKRAARCITNTAHLAVRKHHLSKTKRKRRGIVRDTFMIQEQEKASTAAKDGQLQEAKVVGSSMIIRLEI
ncbi:hypothetical protein ACET3Z_010904 [Daucus carota]